MIIPYPFLCRQSFTADVICKSNPGSILHKIAPIRRAGFWCLLVVMVGVRPAPAVELPADYFKLLETQVETLEDSPDLEANPGAMLAAAVLYTQEHPANPAFGDKKKLELALRLGDLSAVLAEQDAAENKQDYEWEIHFWLDTYRLLEKDLGKERRAHWKRELEKITRWFVGQVDARLDFPRYQSPFIRTSTNHLSLFASTVYLAGRVMCNKEWEDLGTQAMHRLAAEEQTVDGYWGEHTDNGPAIGYNYLTMCCVALYYEHSQDKSALKALQRATDFHMYFTWPDGTPVETINGRNRHWKVNSWGHFGFSHWPEGRGYAKFLLSFFTGQQLGSRDLGRFAQNTLYYHEGPTAPIPQELPQFAYRMKVPAGIRKTGPWSVCLSGLIDQPIVSQFTLDRQGHLSVFHEKLGLIITGANSKHQPELATFLEKDKDQIRYYPVSSRLRMGDARDRLGLAYGAFFAELEIPTPSASSLPFHFKVVELGRGSAKDIQLNLQLCLHGGEVLKTAKTTTVLSDQRIELEPNEIGGWLRHRGWTLKVPPTARLVWPIYPFNPYSNAPETDLQSAVGALTIPIAVSTPPASEEGLDWGQQEIAFTLEVGE